MDGARNVKVAGQALHRHVKTILPFRKRTTILVRGLCNSLVFSRSTGMLTGGKGYPISESLVCLAGFHINEHGKAILRAEKNSQML